MNKFHDKNIEILIVNYCTPDLMINLYNSIRDNMGGDYAINVVDGSDNRLNDRGESFIELNKNMISLFNSDDKVKHHRLGWNIHHGPGMDYGIRKIKSDYILILDSDAVVKPKVDGGIIGLFNNKINKDFYCCGLMVQVDSAGCNVLGSGIDYIHPSIMLLDRNNYLNKGVPFIKHGAPCINFMKKTNPKYLIDLNVRDHIYAGGRGTCGVLGYNS